MDVESDEEALDIIGEEISERHVGTESVSLNAYGLPIVRGQNVISSPVILWKKIGQPPTNCNRRFFNGFRPCNVPLKTYQKSQKIPLQEVTEKRDLLWSSETRFMSAWERGWPKMFLESACKDL